MNKVLFIIKTEEFGGTEILLLDWLKYIDYEKNSVFLATNTDFFSEKLRKLGLPVRCITVSLPFEGHFWDIYRKWLVFFKEISPEKIVMVKSWFFKIPLPIFLAAYRETRGNIYATEHLAAETPPERKIKLHFGFIPGLGIWWYKRFWQWILRGYLSKRILAVSSEVKNKLLLYKYPKGKISVIYHGIDVSGFSPSQEGRKKWRQDHSIPEEDLVFVSTARLSRLKRLERLILGFDALCSDHENIWLALAGDGPLKDEIIQLVDTVSKKERIKILGHVEDVKQLLQASDIYVLSSDNEGLSIALTEAMSTGLICVTGNVPGSNEIIENGTNGILVEASHEGIINGMKKGLNMSMFDRNSMAQKARQTALDKFEMAKSINNVLRFMDIEIRPGKI